MLRNPVDLPAQKFYGTNLRFSPDGRFLAFQGRSSTSSLVVWDVAAQRPRLEGVACWISDRVFAFNPVLPIFVGLGANSVLTLFSLESGEAIRSLDFALGRRVMCVAFSPDGLTCAVGGSNKQFAVFDVDL